MASIDTNKLPFPLIPFAFIIVLIFFSFPRVIHPEVIYLKNKKTLEGSITGQTGSMVELRTPRGIRKVPKVQIVRIRYVPFTEKEKAAIAARKKKLRLQRQKQREKLERVVEAQKEEKARLAQEKRLQELEDRILAEKKKEAEARANRAAALRELVDKGQMEKPEDEPISYMDFAWRSMLLPGWGHFYLDRPVMGSVYAAGATYLVYNFYQRREKAREAIAANKRETMNNAILTAVPRLAPLSIRTVYSVEANRRAFKEYKRAVDDYNYSLYLIEVFYAVQLLHIIYNGIAWEEGLFIVNNDRSNHPIGIHFALGALPSQQGDRKTTVTGTFGLDYRF